MPPYHGAFAYENFHFIFLSATYTCVSFAMKAPPLSDKISRGQPLLAINLFKLSINSFAEVPITKSKIIPLEEAHVYNTTKHLRLHSLHPLRENYFYKANAQSDRRRNHRVTLHLATRDF